MTHFFDHWVSSRHDLGADCAITQSTQTSEHAKSQRVSLVHLGLFVGPYHMGPSGPLFEAALVSLLMWATREVPAQGTAAIFANSKG